MRGKRAKALRRIAYAVSQRPEFKSIHTVPQTWIVPLKFKKGDYGIFHRRRRVGVRFLHRALKKEYRAPVPGGPLIEPIKLKEWHTRPTPRRRLAEFLGITTDYLTGKPWPVLP